MVFQVRKLVLRKQLFFQPVPGDSENNEGGLSLQLWLVGRVSKLSVKDEMEIPVEFTFFFFFFCLQAGYTWKGINCTRIGEIKIILIAKDGYCIILAAQETDANQTLCACSLRNKTITEDIKTIWRIHTAFLNWQFHLHIQQTSVYSLLYWRVSDIGVNSPILIA